MLSEPTTIVLGAGASFEFGLPVGSILANDIQERLTFEFDYNQTRGDRDVFNQYRATGSNIQDFTDAARSIAAALPYFKSIDDCLHSHAENKLGVLAGKMTIAKAIADAEGGSIVANLWSQDRRIRQPALEKIQATWAGNLMRILVTGLPRASYRDIFNDVTIISFNYDRCIESIMFHLVQSALGLSREEATEAMIGLTVYHPYGSLGSMKLHSGAGTRFAPIDFDLLGASEKLFVYTEERDVPSDIQEMQAVVHSSKRLLFLGFGYHLQNIKILSSPGKELNPKLILGTVLDEPSPSVRTYQDRIGRYLGNFGPWELVGVDCTTYLKTYNAMIGG